jgi:serine/threonine-protein kinase
MSATAQKHCPACGASYPVDYAVCPRDATPLYGGEGGDDPLIGTILGDTYEVLRRLGEGGMGRVYEARHVRLGRRFAVKVLHLMFADDRDALARFRREATAAAAIVSPYVAQVVDINATRDGRPYLVCEFLDGEDLGSLLEREGTLPIARAARVARQVARGLQAAHHAGVVHRDLKPENVMLVRDSECREVAKVLDFGIAKVVSDDKMTRTGAVLGTPSYMAPEQARGGATLDHRCDVYALGAMLYRSVTGRAAFTGEDAGRTLTSVIHDEPARPKTIRRDIPDALELIIQRAMAKDPNARFASMVELEAALAPFDPENATVIINGAAPPTPDMGREPTMIAQTGENKRINPNLDGQARRARPRAIAYGLLSLMWCMVLAGSVLSYGIMEVTRHSLSSVDRMLSAALAATLSAPLAVLEVRWLMRGAWRNTMTMMRRGDTLERACAMSLGAYAFISAPGRLWALFEHGPNTPSPTELLALVVATGVGTAVLARSPR